jgi:hypothetical protein
LIAIREYYEKEGKTLPGKSGISLTPEQLTAVVLALPDIKEVLAEKGIVLADGTEADDESDDDVKVETKREIKEDTEEDD